MAKSKKPSYLDLDYQFTFYASYHHHPVNAITHVLCVWPILATAVLILQYTPSFIATPIWLSELPMVGPYISFNMAFVTTMVYFLFYFSMDKSLGLITLPLLIAVYLGTSKMVMDDFNTGFPLWQLALMVHVAGWIAQFVTHYGFEGRAPALLDSLDQALLTAPLFVLLEVLCFFGFREKWHKRIMRQVEINISEFKRDQNKDKKRKVK